MAFVVGTYFLAGRIKIVFFVIDEYYHKNINKDLTCFLNVTYGILISFSPYTA